METRFTNCAFCDQNCLIKADVPETGPAEGTDLNIRPGMDDFPAMCSKAHMVDEYRLHPDRLTHPLKNVGTREDPVWERISWDQALDEIAERLRAVIDEYGPEAFAVSEMPNNHGFGGITRRLMNHLGSPNYISPLSLCMGNTAQVHRAVYGAFSQPDWDKADCIIYFGQNRGPELWPAEYLCLKAALDRGATLVVIDPRETETAKLAKYHLRIRYGTDAALALSWINVIIEEDLYDHAFVREKCIGFDELRECVAKWTPEYASEICGIDANTIRKTAYVYALSKAAIIPWGVVPDMQANSTSLIQAQCILRAICGFLSVSEHLKEPARNPDIMTNAQVADFDVLPESKRRLQLGANDHPLLTFRASALYRGAWERKRLNYEPDYEPDLLAQSTAAVPQSVFQAMRCEHPYPVKAFFAVANNTVMSYADQRGIIGALLNQDLVVVFENWMTPTAQLADYVLPGDMWAERDLFGSPLDSESELYVVRRALRPRVGECKSWYFVVKGLADRLGLADAFPSPDEYALYAWRSDPKNYSPEKGHIEFCWDELCERGAKQIRRNPAYDPFWTPSRKVELASSVLADLCDRPLPRYEEPDYAPLVYLDRATEIRLSMLTGEAMRDGASFSEAFLEVRRSWINETYPYVVFAGVREPANYNTNLRQIPSLRKRTPEPQLFINPSDAEREGICEGAWCTVEAIAIDGTPCDSHVQLQAHLDDAQPAGTLRIPHGWWKPEAPQGLSQGLSGACLYNDGMLFSTLSNKYCDGPQGVPNLRGFNRARITHAS